MPGKGTIISLNETDPLTGKASGMVGASALTGGTLVKGIPADRKVGDVIRYESDGMGGYSFKETTPW